MLESRYWMSGCSSDRLVWRSYIGDENVGAGVFFVVGQDLLFVVGLLGVDFPWVEVGAAEEAQGGVLTGEHGVVLVVVAVHAVATCSLEVGEGFCEILRKKYKIWF